MEGKQERNNQHPLFPDYNITINSSGKWREIRIETTIRKQNLEGLWFLQDIIEHVLINNDHFDEIESVFIAEKKFIKNCYIMMVLGVVNDKILSFDGSPVFKLDSIQESEQERMKQTRI